MSTQHEGLPPAYSYHRLPIRAINAAWSTVQALGLAHIHHDEARLLDKACQQTGLDDFGDEDFLPGLRQVISSTLNEAELNPLGQVFSQTNILRLLRNRLIAEDLFKKHPEILAQEMPAPVVVLGLGRSGTTRLHRLLACDDRFLNIKSWETVYPAPWPQSSRTHYAADPRITAIEKALKAVMYMGPQIAAIHPLGAHEVEEEVGLIQHGFETPLFNTLAFLPSYANWQNDNDNIASYRYMEKLLKLISWYRGDDLSKPWILKTPQHMQDLDELMRVFPNARLVCTHRDPLKATGSICSTAWNAIVRDRHTLNPHLLGEQWFKLYDDWVTKALHIRDTVVALDRVPGYEPGGRTFESCRSQQTIHRILQMPCVQLFLARSSPN